MISSKWAQASTNPDDPSYSKYNISFLAAFIRDLVVLDLHRQTFPAGAGKD